MGFEHHPHARTVDHPPPPQTTDERVGINGRIGKGITVAVGTMWCAYAFTILALISLPTVINTGDKVIIVAWITQTFIQLVLLPIIIVGQNIQSRAADKRADATYKDAEAVLHEALEIQRHLEAQDAILEGLVSKPSSRTRRAAQPKGT